MDERTEGQPIRSDGLGMGATGLLGALEQLERRFEEKEPLIRAFVPEEGRFARLRREANDLLGRFPDPAERPLLFGAAIGVKDIFHVEGMPTGGGSRLPPDELAGDEGAAVSTLKAAGALILGKTVSTEFAYFAPGPTRNPHHVDHTPGGSSSGSAAAVAAGLCPLALGTQTIGSISRPASFCGVVGYKPSYDRIPTDGLIPLAPSLDHVGVLSSDVATSRRAAAVLCLRWTGSRPARRPVLAIPEGPYLERASEEGMEIFRRAGARLEAAGYRIKSVRTLIDFPEIEERHHLIVAAEAAEVHSRWFRRHGDLYHDTTRELIQRGQKVSAESLRRARAGREDLRRTLGESMERHGLDLWISPAAVGPAPEGLDSTGDPVMNLPWTHSGMPTVSVPAGAAASGMPMGLQLAGGWNADESLLAWAEEIEELLRER